MVFRVVGAALLLVHAFVHLRVWLGAVMPGGPDPRHSWLLGEAAGPSRGLAVVAATLTGLAAVGLVAGQDWWPYAALGGSAASAVLIALVFNRWLSLGLGIDLAVAMLAVRALLAN